MDAIEISQRSSSATWTYDGEADVLYLAIDAARPAVGVDIGDGLVVRYHEDQREVVGLTVIGLRDRLAQVVDDCTHGENE